MLADFSAIVIYTNRPSGVVAYLVVMLVSANKFSGTVAGDINLVATQVSVNIYDYTKFELQYFCVLQQVDANAPIMMICVSFVW
jgi:hypothetical protein